MSLLKRLLLTGKGGGGGAPVPIFPMEYLFLEGTSSPYNIYYDDLLGSGAYLVAQTESPYSGLEFNNQRKLVRLSDGTLVACYSRQVAGKYQVHVKYSYDEGATWGSEVLISTVAGMNALDQINSCIAVDSNDHLHVVWDGQATGEPSTSIWYAKYDGSWSTSGPLDTLAGMNVRHNSPAIIAIDSGDIIHVIFRARSNAHPTYTQIFYIKYITSWSTPLRISDSSGMENNNCGPYPAIAIDSSDYIHVVYRAYNDSHPTYPQIFHSKYDGSWAIDVVSTGMSNYNNEDPSIAIDSNDHIHVSFSCSSYANYRVYYNKFDGSWLGSSTLISDGLPTQIGFANWHSTISVDINDYINILWRGGSLVLGINNIWHAQYIVGWIKQCLQSTGTNYYPTLRWSMHP